MLLIERSSANTQALFMFVIGDSTNTDKESQESFFQSFENLKMTTFGEMEEL